LALLGRLPSQRVDESVIWRPRNLHMTGLFAIDGTPNCACHQAADTDAGRRGWEPNDAATLWERQIASHAMSLDA
jgi:hypothetical protein